MAINYEEELLSIFRQLDDRRKQEVIEKAKRVSERPKRVSGTEFIRATKDVNFDSESLAEMQTAIDEAFSEIHDIDVSFDD